MQGGQPVQYASRVLTQTEKRYSQIERCLAWYTASQDSTSTRMVEK